MLLPEGSNLPAIVYSQVSSNYITSLSGVNALQMKRMQFDCYGANTPAAKALAQAVHNLLDGYHGVLSEGSTVQSCFPNQDVDTFEFDPLQFRVALDFDIWFVPFTIPQSMPSIVNQIPVGSELVWNGTEWVPELEQPSTGIDDGTF